MGDEPGLVMPVGVDAYETHSYEMNINICDLIIRTRAFVFSLRVSSRHVFQRTLGEPGKTSKIL